MSHDRERKDAFTRGLLGMVNHELRTPLAAITGNVALLRQASTPLPPEVQQECLAEIAEAAQRLSDAITLMLDVAQFDVHTHSLATQPLELARFIRAAFATFVARAQAQGQSIRFAPAPDEFWVQADPDRLRQVLEQLVDNAIRFSAPGAATVLELGPCTFQSRDGVAVIVRDSGCGIAPEHLPHIFDRFYQADMRLSRERNGLGLGLTLCQQIARAYGGEIRVESRVGIGSAFHLHLPLLTYTASNDHREAYSTAKELA